MTLSKPERSRNLDGRWRKKRSDAGVPRKKKGEYCEKCRHYTLEPKGFIANGEFEIWHCSRCWYRVIRKVKPKEDEAQ